MFILGAEELNLDFVKKLVTFWKCIFILFRYIKPRFGENEHYSILMEAVQDIKTIVANLKTPHRSQIQEIDTRLKQWKNPLRDPQSLL
jgi:hypothetical protein